MCLAAWVPIRKHVVVVGRGWEPISFYTAELPRRVSSLVPSPLLTSSLIPPTWHSSASTPLFYVLRTNFPRLCCCPNESVCAHCAKLNHTEPQQYQLFQRIQGKLKISAEGTFSHQAAVMIKKELKGKWCIGLRRGRSWCSLKSLWCWCGHYYWRSTLDVSN